MSRENGYTVTIKAFVASPRNDFEKQAAAAVMMATITKSKTIPAEFLALASIEDVSAKYGSRLAPETPVEPEPPEGHHWVINAENGERTALPNTPANSSTAGNEPAIPPQSDETAVEGVRKAGRSRG